LQAVLEEFRPQLREEEFKTLEHMVNEQIPQRFEVSNTRDGLGNRVLTGDNLKNLESWLSQRYRDLTGGNNATAYDRELGQAIGHVQDFLHNEMYEQNITAQSAAAARAAGIPGVPEGPYPVEQLGRANAAWKDFIPMRNAAASKGAKEGVFSPNQYLGEIRKNALTTGQFATGRAPNQRFAEAAQSVLPSDIPDSGTSHGLGFAHMIGAGLAGEHLPLSVAVPGIAGMAAYTGPGQAVARGLITGGMPVREPVAEALRRLGPQAAMAQRDAIAKAYFGESE
jgi:hypothetical protein